MHPERQCDKAILGVEGGDWSRKDGLDLLLNDVEAEVLEEKVAEPLVEDLVKVDLPCLLQVLDHNRPRQIFFTDILILDSDISSG